MKYLLFLTLIITQANALEYDISCERTDPFVSLDIFKTHGGEIRAYLLDEKYEQTQFICKYDEKATVQFTCTNTMEKVKAELILNKNDLEEGTLKLKKIGSSKEWNVNCEIIQTSARE